MGEARQRKADGLGFKEKSIDEKRIERAQAKILAEIIDERNMILEDLQEECGEGGWVWCLHCERVYKPDEIRYDPDTGLFMCFYPGCSGDAVMDAFAYGTFGMEKNPEWPVIPEKGVRYSLY
jgi:hypothetical protein